MLSAEKSDVFTAQELVDIYKEAVRRREICRDFPAEAKSRLEYYALPGEVDVQLDIYARASCQKLCQAMQEKLPRELRDEVYKHLHGNQAFTIKPSREWVCGFEVVPIDKNLHDKYLWYEEIEGDEEAEEPQEIEEIYQDSHYFSSRYVGKETKVEIVQEWYRTCFFKLDDPFFEFFTKDRWGLGLRPAKFMRRIELGIAATERSWNGSGMTMYHGVCAMHHILPNQTKMEITIRIYTTDTREEVGLVLSDHWFGDLMEDLHAAHKHGHQIKMFLRRDSVDLPCGRECTVGDWCKVIRENMIELALGYPLSSDQ